MVVLPLAVLCAAFWALRPAASEVGLTVDDRPPPAVRGETENSANGDAGAAVAEKAAVASAGAAKAAADGSVGAVEPAESAVRPDAWVAKVVDSFGRPVAGARVRIRRVLATSFDGDLPLDPNDVLLEEVLTDDAGLLVVDHHAGWRFDVVVEAAGRGRVFVSDHAASDTLVMPEPRDFAGRVVDADQRPVEGALVRIYDGPRDPLEVRTDADGRYVAYGAATAPTLVEVRHRDFSADSQSVRISDEPSANFRLSPGATVSAGVAADGASAAAAPPAQNAAERPSAPDAAAAEPGTAYLFDRWTRTLHERVELDADGRLAFGGLTPGRDYLVAVRRGGRSGEGVFRGGDAFPALPLDVSPELRVAVEDEDGAPLAGASVTLRRFDGLAFDDGPSAYTGADGVAQAPGARSGVRFRIVVYRHGFAAAERRDVTLTAGERRTEVFRLRRAVPFAGVAKGGDGRPLAGALVRVTRNDGLGAPPLFAYAAADGTFAFAGVAEGAVTVLVLTAGYAVEREQRSVGPHGDVGVILVRARDLGRTATRR